jgi:hypothetical protein
MAASLGLLWLHHRVVPVKMPTRPVVTVPVPDELDPAAGVREVAHA